MTQKFSLNNVHVQKYFLGFPLPNLLLVKFDFKCCEMYKFACSECTVHVQDDYLES